MAVVAAVGGSLLTVSPQPWPSTLGSSYVGCQGSHVSGQSPTSSMFPTTGIHQRGTQQGTGTGMREPTCHCHCPLLSLAPSTVIHHNPWLHHGKNGSAASPALGQLGKASATSSPLTPPHTHFPMPRYTPC